MVNYKIIIRNNLVEKILNLVSLVKMPNHVKSFVIKSFHFHAPLYFLLLVILLEYQYALYCIFFMLIIFMMFLFLDGCILSIVEYKLDNNKYVNIIDPILHLFEIETTNLNRYYGTIITLIVYFIVVIYILVSK